MNLDRNQHSVYSLNYHLIMVVKYRRKVINDVISARLRELFERIAVPYSITVLEWNHDIDHIHVLFKAAPRSELSKFINAYKSASSRHIKREFPEIRSSLWQDAFWSKSFCLIGVGDLDHDAIAAYIRSQGEKSHGNS